MKQDVIAVLIEAAKSSGVGLDRLDLRPEARRKCVGNGVRVLLRTANTIQAVISAVIRPALLLGWLLNLDVRDALGVRAISKSQCYLAIEARSV